VGNLLLDHRAPTKTTTKFSYGMGLGVRADIGRSFVGARDGQPQYVDFSNFGSTPWVQWRIDLGTRF